MTHFSPTLIQYDINRSVFRFNGLLAPHWRSDARGTIVGLTQYTSREHICRATLEAVAFQVYEILLAMEKDSKHKLKALLVDGGMTKNDLLMQIQADFNGNYPGPSVKRELWKNEFR